MKKYTDLLSSLYAPLTNLHQVPKIVDDKDTYQLSIGVNQTTLPLLQEVLIENVLTTFVGSLKLEIGAKDSESPVGIYNREDVRDYIRDYDDSVEHAFFITLNKSQLLRHEFKMSNAKVIWHITAEATTQEFAQNLGALEARWFNECQRFIFIVDQSKCYLKGDWLSILGSDLDSDVLQSEVAEARTNEDCELITNRVKRRSLETRWLGGVRRLLPDHLFCVPQPSSERCAEIEGHLYKNCMDLIVCSVANVTEPVNVEGREGWIARFEGQKQVTVGTDGLNTVPYESCHIWFDLYCWVYGASKVNEAMGILRNLLTLQPYDQSTQNYSLLVSWGDELTKSVASHYTKFIGSSVEQYFAKLKESAGFFQGKVDALNKQVTDLIDAFMKNLLAVFGVVTGTLVVKALDTTAQSQGILPLLFLGFAIYVALVGGSYYIVTWKSYKLTRAEYEKNLDVARSFFTSEDLTKYVGTAFKERERLFINTFWSTAVIYLVMCLAGLYCMQLTVNKKQDDPNPKVLPVMSPSTVISPISRTTPSPKSDVSELPKATSKPDKNSSGTR
jgi:hypothetical protein